MVKNKIVIFENEQTSITLLENVLGKDFILQFASTEDVDKVLKEDTYVLAIINYQLEGALVLKKIKLKEPTLKILVLSKEQNLAEIIMAIKMGGAYFLSKPLNEEAVRKTVHQILEGMTYEILEVYGEYPWYLSTHPNVEELLRTAKNVALHNMDVVICGEQGTGKEALANFIHQNGPRRNRQLATLNLGYFQGEAIETHFWAALREIFQEYDNTIVGHSEPLYSTLHIQGLETQDIYFRMSLIEWLKSKRKEAEEKFQVPIRIIFSIRDQSFLKFEQQDSLKCFVWLELLPLRKRREDIPLFIEYLLAKYNTQFNKHVTTISLEVLKKLMMYHWPGNLRELQLMIKTGMSRIAENKNCLSGMQLPITFSFLEEIIPVRKFSAVVALRDSVKEYEKILLQYLYEKSNYTIASLADLLSDTIEQLEDKLNENDIVLIERSTV